LKIDDLLSYLNRFSRKSSIYYRIWTDFSENWQFTPVSEWISRKNKEKDHFSTQNEFWNGLFLL